MNGETPLWQPSREAIAASPLTRFAAQAAERAGRSFADYRALHAWSVDERAAFWNLVWDFCGVVGDKGERLLDDGERMPGARFFPDASLNFAENLLRRADDADAIVFRGEDGATRRLSWRELNDLVSRLQQALGGRRRRRRRSCRRPAPQHARGDRGDAGHRFAGRRVVVGLARFRRQRGRRPLRPDRAQGVLRRRRLSLCRQGNPSGREARASHPRACRSATHHHRALPRRGGARRRGVAECRYARRRAGALRGEARRLYARALRPPALYPVLVRHDRRAEMHRPFGRRHAAPAPEGAPPAVRHRRRRSRLLLHHARLDDVELAGVGAGLGRDAAPLRRLALPSSAGGPLRLCRGGARHLLRHLGQVHRRGEEGRLPAGRPSRPVARAHHRLDRLAAGAGELRFRL